MKFIIILLQIAICNTYGIPHKHGVSSTKIKSPSHVHLKQGVCKEFNHIYIGNDKPKTTFLRKMQLKGVSYCFSRPESYCLKFLMHDKNGNMNVDCGVL